MTISIYNYKAQNLTDIMKKQDFAEYAQQNNNVLAWLETISKAKNSPRQPLEQQLQSLTLSYKNAQEKLLSLQKQVYHECLHNEKQRSIIQILKYIINGNLDDDTILSYLVQMQDQSCGEFEVKYEIRSELEQIKDMVLKRKNNGKKEDSLKNAAIADLKRQITKCNHIKKELMEDLDRTLSEKGNLQMAVEQMNNQLEGQHKKQEIFHQQIKQLQQQNSHLSKQINIKDNKIQQHEQYVKKLRKGINNLLKYDNEKQQSCDLLKEVEKMYEKLQKYRNVAKDLTEKSKKNTQTMQLIQVLKMFLPEEAVKICDEFQTNGQKCLLKQIQNIAKLQRKKIQQLENCQQQVWRLKSKLLRQGYSYSKSGKTGITFSIHKQNLDPNLRNYNQEVTEFSEKDLN